MVLRRYARGTRARIASSSFYKSTIPCDSRAVSPRKTNCLVPAQRNVPAPRFRSPNLPPCMKQKLKIAFFGSSLVSAYWNGAATYYRGLVRALHERGHKITFYEPDAYQRQEHRDMDDPPWATVVVYPAHEDQDGLIQNDGEIASAV